MKAEATVTVISPTGVGEYVVIVEGSALSELQERATVEAVRLVSEEEKPECQTKYLAKIERMVFIHPEEETDDSSPI